MKNSSIHCAEDFREHARRKLPRFVFDFIDGAAEQEIVKARNRDAFETAVLIPRIGKPKFPSRAWSIFSKAYQAPFGIAPMGLAELVCPGGDVALAQAASDVNIPYVCSATTGTPIEYIVEQTGTAPWFQMYIPRDTSSIPAWLNKLNAIGVPVLIVTVDTPAPGRRLRDLRNRFQLPLKLRPRLAWQVLRSPRWLYARLRSPPLAFPNLNTGADIRESMPFHELMSAQTGGCTDWSALDQLRDRWRGTLVLKGILSSEDAVQARHLGIDGLIVSNHGGRQFDAAPASLDALRSIRPAITDIPLMLDSGIRSGTDVLKALAAGCDLAFVGRPFLYALGTLGLEGPATLARMLISEYELASTLYGAGHLIRRS